MLNFYDLIEQRESIRSYDPSKPVPEDVLMRILNAGRMAPSACNKQPWEFWVIESQLMREKVYTAYARDWFLQAPQILIVVGDKNEAWVRNYDQYISIETDLAIAMDHMILAAEYEGVATCWIGAFEPKILSNILNLQPHQCVYCMTPLGYPPDGFQKKQQKSRKPLDTLVKIL